MNNESKYTKPLGKDFDEWAEFFGETMTMEKMDSQIFGKIGHWNNPVLEPICEEINKIFEWDASGDQEGPTAWVVLRRLLIPLLVKAKEEERRMCAEIALSQYVEGDDAPCCREACQNIAKEILTPDNHES